MPAGAPGECCTRPALVLARVSCAPSARTSYARPAGRAAPSAPAKPEPRSVMDARLRCPTAVCPPGRALRVRAAQLAETCSRKTRVSGSVPPRRVALPPIREIAGLRGQPPRRRIGPATRRASLLANRKTNPASWGRPCFGGATGVRFRSPLARSYGRSQPAWARRGGFGLSSCCASVSVAHDFQCSTVHP